MTESAMSKRISARGKARAVHWQGWVAVAVLAALWLGVGFIPGLKPSWMWLGRAAIFFVAAGVLWFAYDPADPEDGP